MKKLLFILLVCCSFNGFSQQYYYIDVSPSQDKNEFFDKLDKQNLFSREDIVYDKYLIPQTRTEFDSLLVSKKKLKKKKQSSIRLYLQYNGSFDEVTIVGFGRNYLFTENNNSIQPLFVISLADYQDKITTDKYEQLSSILISLINDYYQNDSTFNFPILSFIPRDELKVLKPSFHLFTCPEVYLFSNPTDDKSQLELRDCWNFIEGSKYDYETHPTPQEILFKLTFIQIEGDSIYRFKGSYRAQSNLKLSINYDFIGLKYTRNNNTRTFWAKKNYISDYLKGRGVFFIALEFFKISAIGESINSLYE